MKNLKIKTLLAFYAICILSCNSNKKIERENEPTIYNVGENDIEMNNSIEKAKQTIDSFDYALQNPNLTFNSFSLKKKFEENGNIEHIWLANIQKLTADGYIGIINNLPEKIKSVKLGDTVEIKKNEISDWMYLNNSELHGGYTIRLLRNRMTEEERKNLDAESGMIIK